jgi:phage shock protein A
MLDQMVRDYSENIREAEAAVAQTIGLARQNGVVDQLKQGLDQMRGKLGELTAKSNQLVNRARVAAPSPRSTMHVRPWTPDPTSAIGRYEENIHRQEATVRGQQELASSSLEAEFASLGNLGEQTEVEARLAALKSLDCKAIDY